MLLKPSLALLFLAMAIFASVAIATASDHYDLYNLCGAPFCGSVGAAAAAGAVARMDRRGPVSNQNDKPIKTPSKV
ncbi:hypothetical protein EKO04_008801 [Ascochyta lentis]|uniref:Uncharacterized protein n=1 Tax=Ascochyta lentis TaxID=205686 RepID=A0A8H7IYT4_9PLEO|nr:hypothetical protein EKO04_008801 [Ascochyta lentis]